MKNSVITYNKILLVMSMFWLMMFAIPTFAQDEDSVAVQEEDGYKHVRPAFESTWIIDNQTTIVPQKGTLEFMIQHRFGTIGADTKDTKSISDLWGLYAPSNIRLAMCFTLFDNLGFGLLKGPLAIGIGSTKNEFVQDVNFKYAFLHQTRNNKIPVSVTYYGNVAISTKAKKEELPNQNESDRFSYFHQIIISRRFSPELSVQIAPSVSHFNVVEPEMKNDHFAVAVSARYKFSPQSSIIVNVDQPLTSHTSYNPQPNFGIGMEVSTGSHSFQMFITSFNSIIAQRNNVFNQNAGLTFYDGSPHWDWKGFVIGFNINRLWNF